MSVVSSERNLSKMQFVKIAQDLLKFTTCQCMKLSKRLTFFITKRVVYTAQDVYMIVLEIRNIFSKNSASIKRIELCEMVIAKLDFLASLLDILIVYAPIQEPEHYDKKKKCCLSAKIFERWIALIEEESLLIKGLIKKEKTKPLE